MEKLRDSDIGTVCSNITEIVKQMSLSKLEVTSVVHGRKIPHTKLNKSRDASRDLGHKKIKKSQPRSLWIGIRFGGSQNQTKTNP